MFVRRLLMFFVLLFAVTALTAGLAPPPRKPATGPEPSPVPVRERTSLVEETLDAGRSRPRTITLHVGDLLRLTVRSDAGDAVELQGLGIMRAVGAGTPVTFDVLPGAAGSYPVVLSGEGRTVGTVRVLTRPR
ncbi:MAG: hypothetical protein QOG87_3018 [Actinomycetota bacterium]|jgi:hypothetical protein